LTSSLELFMARLGAIGAPRRHLRAPASPSRTFELFVRFLHETKEQGLPIPEIKSRLARWGVTRIRVTATEEAEEDDFTLAREIYGNAVECRGPGPEGRAERRKHRAAPESDRVVREMSGMVSRNRDAMLALTLIKNFDEYTYTIP